MAVSKLPQSERNQGRFFSRLEFLRRRDKIFCRTMAHLPHTQTEPTLFCSTRSTDMFLAVIGGKESDYNRQVPSLVASCRSRLFSWVTGAQTENTAAESIPCGLIAAHNKLAPELSQNSPYPLLIFFPTTTSSKCASLRLLSLLSLPPPLQRWVALSHMLHVKLVK